jgi:predicted lipoprotein
MTDSVFDDFIQEDFGFSAIDEVEYKAKTETLEQQLQTAKSSSDDIKNLQEQINKVVLHQSSMDDVMENNTKRIEKKIDQLLTVTSTQIQEILNDQGRSMEELSELICKSADDELQEKYDAALKAKMGEIEKLIIPFLKSLAKDETKEYIYWPNRKPLLEKKAKALIEITRKL